MRIDEFSTSAPSFLAFVNFDATAGKQTANRVFDLVDPSDELLAILDERAMFSHLLFRHMDRRELPHHRHSSQFE